MYEAWLKHYGNWFPGVRFQTLAQMVRWMGSYDPDGMEPIQIRDIENDRLVTLDELQAVMRLPPLRRAPHFEAVGNWKEDGF